MPKGVYVRTIKRKPPYGGFVKVREYIVWVGDNAYHVGTNKREAYWAMKRAQRPWKGNPAPASGKPCFLTIDGVRA